MMMRTLSLLLVFSFLTGIVFCQPLFPADGKVFRSDVIPRVEITINEDSLKWLYNNVLSDKEFDALFVYTVAGVPDSVSHVGFGLRGNTSRHSAKKSFKVSFNTFSKGKKFHGLEKMNLNGEHNDPSLIRSHLTWGLFKSMQVVAPRSNHVEVYINKRYYGLYINVEHVDEEFVESRFGNNFGNLYKCLYPANLAYLGGNKTDYKKNGYELKTNTDQDDFSDLIGFVEALSNSTPNQFPEKIEPIFNVNAFLRNLAVEIFTGHWDAYSFNKNNFYLFKNVSTGKFEFIPYDTDNTFGIDWFGIDWANRNIYSWWNPDDPRPLTSKIFENQSYKDRFSFFLNQLVTIYANPDTYFSEIDAIKSKINPSAANDPYRPIDYGWGFEDFNKSYTLPMGKHVKYGLKPFITTRINSIRQQLILRPIAPIIENVVHSIPQLNQPTAIQLNITDDQPAVVAKVYYQINHGATNSLQLILNPDNKYKAELPALDQPATLSYYIEATDTDGKKSREPSVGVYSLHVTLSNASLVLSEFLSSNKTGIVDNYGGDEDWIEIKNTGNQSVNLKGKYLSDDLANPTKFELPDVTIEPNHFYLVWADEDGGQGLNHANFKLNADGESIGLFDSYENNFSAISFLTYTSQKTDVSTGINSSGKWENQAFITPMGENGSTNVAFITFSFNMNRQIRQGSFNPEKDYIDVAGTFNNWSGTVKVFDGNQDGIYQYTAFGFQANETIQYKARINGNWNTAEFPELGGNGNRFYTLHSNHNRVDHWYNDETSAKMALEKPDGGIRVFPNPSRSGNFMVESPSKIRTIEIFSLAGDLVYRKEVDNEHQTKIFAVLRKGWYLIRVKSQEGEYQSKVLVD